MQFLKMHGIGNDFVVIDARGRHPSPQLAVEDVRRLASRHTGVGFDQLVQLRPGDDGAAADVAFHNADGSEAGACGNGLRCAAAVVMRETDQTSVQLRTVSGARRCALLEDGRVSVEMGAPFLDWRDVPLSEARETRAFPAPGSLAGDAGTVSAVGMGNPHCVVFSDDLVGNGRPMGRLARLGLAVQSDSLFPEGVNLSIAEVRDPRRLRLHVWERGAGLTRACGSAACAAVVAGVRRDLLKRSVEVEFRRGSLEVSWPGDDGPVTMTGPVAAVYRGELDPSFLGGGHVD